MHLFSRVYPCRQLVYMGQKLRGRLGGVTTTGVTWGPGWPLQKLLEILLCGQLFTTAVGGYPIPQETLLWPVRTHLITSLPLC